ncbi:DUF4082 domain-containing protein [Microbacterium sp. 10M-3C3]|jgi:hypothetical protein|uniref:DUF4082 domain-containing protein n=1 Tax=Microbacterium sp. 10M-3C3 TaxID=2483401 RepID=UPI0013DDCE36|nr:DUF4082 domain-containing protein [Microbacterium sp. 10M-3C3]
MRARWAAVIALAALIVSLLAALPPSTANAASTSSSPCGATVNAIVCENQKPGTSPDVWDIDGAGDPSIQGFATDISVNAGQRIDFKIDTDASAYAIDIYRTGWYQGLGARKITSVAPSAPLPQRQPQCLTDVTTELYDCGTWGVSASWTVPADAVSGVYIAKLTRKDTGGASHIIFIVRQDGNTSDVLFQTSDPTWHAYNTYGGSNFYRGAANGRAYKISYNRPFATRGGVEARDFYFSAEYATVRFLERNGYDMTYIAGLDTDRRGAELLKHKVFLSVGHDEYWSGAQRKSIEAARDAGVNLQFLTGNEGYWRTRYEDSTTGASGNQRTLVSYKETWGQGGSAGTGAKIDPSSQWTGTWRDPRFATPAQGGASPENALTGTMYMVNDVALPVTVSAEEGKTRLWRNTTLANLTAGTTRALAEKTVGYEANEDIDNGMRPQGLVRLSTTVGPTPQYLTDYGNTVVSGTTTHHVTLYRAASGALVFSAASVQWGWGLDATHDGDGPAADVRMQQAEVNLLADMGAQPGSLMSGLVRATKSTDTTAPVTTISSPTQGQQIAHGTTVTVTGTASDVGGRVAGVEVSTDGGTTWHPATGTTSWSYRYVQQGSGSTAIIARAIDDSANFSRAGVTRTVSVVGPSTVFGTATPTLASANDPDPAELGLRFTPDADGFVTGVRFYKGAANTGTHVGSLWDSSGRRLAQVTFPTETATGWQTATLSTAVPVIAGQTYTVSYTAPRGGYAMDARYWPYTARQTTPLTVSSAVGAAAAGVFGTAGTFPTGTWNESNYYVDVVFSRADTSPVRLVAQTPAAGVSSVDPAAAITATFLRDVVASSVKLTVTGPGGTAVAGTLSYDATTRTARFAPASALAASTAYTVTPAATDASGVTLADGSAWTFTTRAADRAAGDCPCSLWNESRTPTIASDADADLVTLGVAFTPSVDGTVTALKFYKGAANTGTHVGALWDAAGNRLARVTFQNESTAGWQTAMLDTPVTVTAGTRYVASYLAPNGRYAVTANAFSAPYQRGPLSVAAGGSVYTYADAFPNQSSTTDYGVDLVFQQSQPAPAVVSRTPDAGATAATDTQVSATFDRAVVAGYSGTVTADGAPVTGSWTTSSDGKTVRFAPSQPFAEGAQVAVSLSGIRATAGGTAATVSWTFQIRQSTPPVTLLGTTTPTSTQTAETASVELGMAFRSTVAGTVTAIRFYKAAGDTGTHTGSLWDATGTRLAQVTFPSESASGWQRAVLSTPVTLTAGQTYTVSYLSPRGAYTYTSRAFATAVSSGPLTTVAPDNGRYRYGSGGAVPTDTWNSTNYFVDVEFRPAADGSAVSMTGHTPDGSNVPTSAAITATLSGDAPTPTLGLATSAGAIAGSSAWATSSRTLTFTPSAALTAGTTYTATVRIAGNVLDQWTFTTAPPVVTGDTYTLFGTTTPATPAATDTAAVEVGTAFTVAKAGQVTAIRFYKSTSNTGTHVGSLWDASGARVARVTFPNETASGWQRGVLSQPVTVSPGQTYVVSYLAPNGRYAIAPQYFTTAKTAGPITAPAGANGRFLYGAAGGMPTSSWNSSAYFVDAEIVFPTATAAAPSPSASPSPSPTGSPSPSASASPSPSPSASSAPSPSPETSAAPTPAPTQSAAPAPVAVNGSAIAPASGATDVAPTTTVAVTLAPAPAEATVAVAGPGGPVAGTSRYDVATGAVEFTPARPLDWSTTYTASVAAPGATVTPASWSFSTAAQPQVADAATIFGDATPQHPWWADPDQVQVATRFSVSEPGRATGIRFYKGSENTGAHTGYLWRASDGARLAEVSFDTETADGWQSAKLSTPVTLETGVEYRVGLFSTTGRYAVDLNTLAQPTTVGPFQIPANGGAYTYSRDFPDGSSPNNYWVDVLFEPTG